MAERAGAILTELGPDKAAERLLDMDMEAVGPIINTMAPAMAATSLNAMGLVSADANAASIALEAMPPESALGILGYMSIEVRVVLHGSL